MDHGLHIAVNPKRVKVADSKAYSIEEALKMLGQDLNALTDDITAKAKAGVAQVALQTHAFILEQVQAKLKSTRQTYIDNLNVLPLESTSDQVIWAVTLGKDAGWIEEGTKAGPMFDQILNHGKAPKISKEGNAYKIIPFKHNKARSQQTASAAKVANFAKKILKAEGLDKVVNGPSGAPILGRVASIKTISDPKQPTNRFNRPLLAGLTVYQREQKDKQGNVMKDKNGKSKIQRDVMTFRVISDAQRGSGMWESKGTQGAHFFEEASKKVDEFWDKLIRDIMGT